MQKEDDYIHLLNIFVNILEANKDIPADDKILDAEGLARKCFFHAASLIYLLRSTNVPELSISFFDPASIAVVARAAFESFLVFHYVFVEPTTEEQERFRYLLWKLADLMERQRYNALSPLGKAKQEQEKILIEEIKDQIRQNQNYGQLQPKQQKAALEDRKWRFKSWTDIGLSAGLSEDYAKSCYRFVCSYAHAGSMSVLQLRQAETAEQQKALCGATMALTMISMAYFVKSYCLLFQKSKEFLKNNEEFSHHIKLWVEIGSIELKNVDVDWSKLSL